MVVRSALPHREKWEKFISADRARRRIQRRADEAKRAKEIVMKHAIPRLRISAQFPEQEMRLVDLRRRGDTVQVLTLY